MQVSNIPTTIKEIFNEGQMSRANHQRNVVKLKKFASIYTDQEIFFNECKTLLLKVLTRKYNVKNIYNERFIEFFAAFCASINDNISNKEEDDEVDIHPLLSKFLEFLLESQSLVDEKVRYWSCILLNKILENLAGTDLNLDLCNQIEEAMLERLDDPKTDIRCEAILCLYRLQNPNDNDDPIIKEYIKLITGDPIAKIRKLCVEKVILNEKVLQYLLGRLRDVNESVRLAAYMRFSEIPDLLKINQRQFIYKCAIVDSSEQIVHYISTSFTQSWFNCYENDYLKFVKSVRLDADEKDIETTTRITEFILNSLFKINSRDELLNAIKLNDKKLIEFEQLDWDTAIYWRIMVQFLRERNCEEQVELVVPELVHFSKYIQDYCNYVPKDLSRNDYLQHQFILKQLFTITKGYDVGDSTSRASLNSLIYQTLLNNVITFDVTEVIVSNLKVTVPNIESKINYISQLVSEIISPLNEERSVENECEIKRMELEINESVEAQSLAVSEKNYAEAARLSDEIATKRRLCEEFKEKIKKSNTEEKRSDIPTIMKYLNIIQALLKSKQINKLNPILRTLKDEIIQELLIHKNDTIKAKALRCYSLCAIIDKRTAHIAIHMFAAPISAYHADIECDSETLIVCIEAVADLLRIYGTGIMAEPTENVTESFQEEHVRIFTGGTSLTDIIQGLVDLMDDEQEELQETAIRGLCSLILSETIHSASLLSRLILKWCNPVVNDRLRYIIGVTLERVPALTYNTELLEQALLYTVKVLVYAPKTNPLSEVSVENIVKFLVALYKASLKGSNMSSLIVKICCEMLKKPRARINVTYSKILLMLNVPTDQNDVQELLKVCDDLRDEIQDKTAVKNIIKFVSSLSANQTSNLNENSS